MSTGNTNYFDFVDEYPSIGEDYSETRQALKQKLQHMAQAVNNRDIANYSLVTPDPTGAFNDQRGMTTGQDFFNLSLAVSTDESAPFFQPTLRKLVRFTGITNAANPNSVAHRIEGATVLTTSYIFTRIYGVIQAVGAAPPLWVPIPNDNVHLEVNSTTVDISIPALYDGYNGIVVLEYIEA